VVPGQPPQRQTPKDSSETRSAEPTPLEAKPIEAKPVEAKPPVRIQPAPPAKHDEPDEPTASSTRDPSEVLRVLTAPRVALKRPIKKVKPKTAKEAMKARAAAAKGARGPSSERAQPEPERHVGADRLRRKRRDASDDAAPDSDADEGRSSEPEGTPAPLGLWQRLKRFFGR
jgi:hypothetical protein